MRRYNDVPAPKRQDRPFRCSPFSVTGFPFLFRIALRAIARLGGVPFRARLLCYDHLHMTDGLSRAYADLLEGEYDCLDRVVLNAYFRFACRPPGFRVWWRQLYGLEAALGNRQLRGLAGRFRHRLRTWATKNQIPFVRCKPGQAQQEIATEYRKTTPVSEGLFLILEGRGPAAVHEVLGKGYVRRKQQDETRRKPVSHFE